MRSLTMDEFWPISLTTSLRPSEPIYPTSSALHFRVYGTPMTQGSHRGRLIRTKTGRTFAAVVPANPRGLSIWRQALALAAGSALADSGLQPDLAAAAVSLRMDFCFHRPQSLAKRFTHMSRGKDVDKLARCLDAFTGILYRDDRQIIDLHVTKRYAGSSEPEGVSVNICWIA